MKKNKINRDVDCLNQTKSPIISTSSDGYVFEKYNSQQVKAELK